MACGAGAGVKRGAETAICPIAGADNPPPCCCPAVKTGTANAISAKIGDRRMVPNLSDHSLSNIIDAPRNALVTRQAVLQRERWTHFLGPRSTPNSAPTCALALFPCRGMCYNRPTVEHAVKPGFAPARQEPAAVSSDGAAAASQAAPATQQHAVPQEDASRYCPVCSQRLESRRCKLICPVCGYYMSCADYY
jgi:hypothetical protein